MNRMFEADEDVAVMEPMVGTKERKTVYIKGIRSVHSEMGSADLTGPDQVRDDRQWHSTVLYPYDEQGQDITLYPFAQPKNGKDIHRRRRGNVC